MGTLVWGLGGWGGWGGRGGGAWVAQAWAMSVKAGTLEGTVCPARARHATFVPSPPPMSTPPHPQGRRFPPIPGGTVAK